MANKVLLKKSSTAAKVPTTSDLDYGELALNYTDGKLYYKTASNTINYLDAINTTATLTNKTLTTPVVDRIDWAATGTGAPTFTSRSAGTKLLLYPAISGSQVDYAMGINSATLWSSVPVNSSSFYFKWYGGTTEVASLDGTGALTVGSINNPTITGTLTAGGSAGTSGQYLQSTATGVQWATVSGGTSISQGNSSVAVVDSGTGTITTTVDATVVQTSTVSGTALSGIPTAPTAAANTSTTQIATTAFAVTEALNKAVAMAIALG